MEAIGPLWCGIDLFGGCGESPPSLFAQKPLALDQKTCPLKTVAPRKCLPDGVRASSFSAFSSPSRVHR
jgi:hypothetical protein